MKKWCLVERDGKLESFIQVVNSSLSILSAWVTESQNKYPDSFEKNRYRYTIEDEAKQVIECHNYPEMALLARVKVSHNTFDEQTAEFRRLRKKYPKCSVGYSQWRPGLTYFES